MVKGFITLPLLVVGALLLCGLFAAFALSALTGVIYAQPLSFKNANNTSLVEHTGSSQFIGVKPINPADLSREAREAPAPLVPYNQSMSK